MHTSKYFYLAYKTYTYYYISNLTQSNEIYHREYSDMLTREKLNKLQIKETHQKTCRKTTPCITGRWQNIPDVCLLEVEIAGTTHWQEPPNGNADEVLEVNVDECDRKK